MVQLSKSEHVLFSNLSSVSGIPSGPLDLDEFNPASSPTTSSVIASVVIDKS